ncbi:hypothetical protein WJX73_000335 [Symbiochloris irregularis]|uniref:Protein kinase domain-containing protein n=1 Tax=Symbiochloris irregularis TaxID=706552 RepID=A0AAW1P3N0_9CHLO
MGATVSLLKDPGPPLEDAEKLFSGFYQPLGAGLVPEKIPIIKETHERPSISRTALRPKESAKSVAATATAATKSLPPAPETTGTKEETAVNGTGPPTRATQASVCSTKQTTHKDERSAMPLPISGRDELLAPQKPGTTAVLGHKAKQGVLGVKRLLRRFGPSNPVKESRSKQMTQDTVEPTPHSVKATWQPPAGPMESGFGTLRQVHIGQTASSKAYSSKDAVHANHLRPYASQKQAAEGSTGTASKAPGNTAWTHSGKTRRVRSHANLIDKGIIPAARQQCESGEGMLPGHAPLQSQLEGNQPQKATSAIPTQVPASFAARATQALAKKGMSPTPAAGCAQIPSSPPGSPKIPWDRPGHAAKPKQPVGQVPPAVIKARPEKDSEGGQMNEKGHARAKAQESKRPSSTHVKAGAQRTILGGKYIWLGKLGEGSFGQVVKAVAVTGSKPVAIKWDLIDGDSGEPNTLEAARTRRLVLAREAGMLKAAQGHPNVVKLLEVVQKQGLKASNPDVEAIVMELATGGDVFSLMFEFVKRGKLMDPLQLAHIILQVGRGLQHLHRQNIAHCELKPDQFLINGVWSIEDDAVLRFLDCTVQLADLGLSRRTPEQQGHLSKRIPPGCKTYAAPEMLDKKHNQVDLKAGDVYSLGKCLMVIMTQNTASIAKWGFLTELNAYKAMKGSRWQELATACDGEYLALFKLAQWLMAPHPADRPSMPEVVNKLEFVTAHIQGRRQGKRAMPLHECFYI